MKRGADTLYTDATLTNGKVVRLNDGYNYFNHPGTNEKVEILVEVKNGLIFKIHDYDTLENDSLIWMADWTIGTKAAAINQTTVDFNGSLRHFYGEIFMSGQSYASYTDTSVDSTGNSFSEWGITPPAKRRK